ncbi:DUF350 domain-containing protein [Vibrio cholerae]|nr:DUF350 domain-containing protein [Vibrio cholerae]EII3003390.1 DUF350 domain-containing protein [Vibrio cholerae]EJL6688785.1 DUF350 domain-containing protein [Vibrio cholerae]EJX1707506.1 DUF350 domain-containing protein [Vibrio cholerae]HDZ9233644.1 DUF350 domain-containing protein [Vibrio cholerae]
MKAILLDYIVTLGWAVVGSLSMGIGITLCLTIFHWTTRDFNEWQELKKGNIAVAIVTASVVLACAWVVSAVIRP